MLPAYEPEAHAQQPVSDQEIFSLVRRLAARIHTHRFGAVALLLLESVRPLCSTAGVAYPCFDPFVRIFFGGRRSNTLQHFLQNPNALAILADEIERLETGAEKPPESRNNGIEP